MTRNKKKILCIRLDKFGDLICTLPVDQVLDPQHYQVTWIIQKGLGSLVQAGELNRRYLEIDKNNKKESIQILSQLLDSEIFDYAVSFQCPWWIHFLLFKKQIPKRIGVLSKWHSFLFLNQGIRQKRSESLMHEFEYNLKLIEKITGPLNLDPKKIYFKLRKPTAPIAVNKFNLPTNYIVIHPGMMGSALNISQEKYIDLIDELIKLNKKCVITGTDADTPYLYQIKNKWLQNDNWKKYVYFLQSQLNLTELIEVLYFSELVVAPSTGVAHMAASLDKKIIGIYSPVTVHRPTRWSPKGPHVNLIFPELNCPAKFECQKQICPHYNCMEKLDLINVIQAHLQNSYL